MPPRQRSSAVRYASKAAADNDKLLVKANRTLHIDVVAVSTSSSSSSDVDNSTNNAIEDNIHNSTVAVAVALQGWRKSMEDHHFIWLRKPKKEHQQKEQKEEEDSQQRLIRSFITGHVDLDHPGRATSVASDGASTINNNPEVSAAVTNTSELQNVSITSSMNNSIVSNPIITNINISNDSTSAVSSPAASPHNASPLRQIANSSMTTSNLLNDQQAIDFYSTPYCKLPHSSNSELENKAATNIMSKLDCLFEQEQDQQKLLLFSTVEGFIGIFDGHGGDYTSKFCSQHLAETFLEHLKKSELTVEDVKNSIFNEESHSHDDEYKNAAKVESPISTLGSGTPDCFLRVEEKLLPIFNKAFLECDSNLRASSTQQQSAPSTTTNSFASAAAAASGTTTTTTTEENTTTNSASNSRAPSEAASSTTASPLSPVQNTATGGSTAAGILILEDLLVMFSVGDCRGAIFEMIPSSSAYSSSQTTSSQTTSFEQQSQQNPSCSSHEIHMRGKIDEDHRATGASPRETARLESIGAVVINGRVGGTLGVSRAFGDFSLKPSDAPDPTLTPVICLPDLCIVRRHPDRSMLVTIGCDGVFELQQLPAIGELVNSSANTLCGAVRVAQKSVATSHPISENGGLLPGSDNVTFVAIRVAPPNKKNR